MFDSVLVANRGEIAVRVMRTLSRLGIRSVAVYSDADAEALHVRTADQAVRIGPAAARASYLSVDAIIGAAVATGAGAIHPGYGFLSENPALAQACADNGIVFVGPPVSAIEAMGDKIAAKARVAAAGVPVVPGSAAAGLSDAELVEAAHAVGLPVLLKPSAGGGGKGMRLVEHAGALTSAIESARREARNSFGDGTLLVERFLRNPRHIEIQVLADQHGNVVHLGERECSLQRRHQKIIEECPSVLLTAATRDEMGRHAVEAARSCGYVGAGTVEFIVAGDRPDEFFFMEMNTRLQVEHPVTEMVYGVDLVEQQLRVAAGETLAFDQSQLEPHGHAIEARIYAEDPATGFLPTGGTVARYRVPSGEGVRVDSGIANGSIVGSDYDPMLAKLITWAPRRADALRRLDAALAQLVIGGVTTNVGFLRRLVADPDVIEGSIDTGLVERRIDALTDAGPPPPVLAAAALLPLLSAEPTNDPWTLRTGWRLGVSATIGRRLQFPDGLRAMAVSRGSGAVWTVSESDGRAFEVDVVEVGPERVRMTIDGRSHVVELLEEGTITTLLHGGESWRVAEVDDRGGRGRAGTGTGDGVIRSPMPGTVIAVHVAAGDTVVAGQPVVIVEAMKMEHALEAPFDGTVGEVRVVPGAPVSLGQVLLTINEGSSPA